MPDTERVGDGRAGRRPASRRPRRVGGFRRARKGGRVLLPALAAAVGLGSAPPLASAQEAGAAGWFPSQGYFDAPLADPRDPSFGVAVMTTNLLRSAPSPHERPPFSVDDAGDLRSDPQVEVALGGGLPLWGGPLWEGGGMTVGAEAGVFARFRLRPSTKDLLGSDWMVAFPLEAARGPLSGRVRAVHWSSHLGDELIHNADAQLLSFSQDGMDAQVAYRPRPELRVYGGGLWIARSSLFFLDADGEEVRPSNRGSLNAGADATWYPGNQEGLGLVSGVHWKSAARTEWDPRLSLRGGVRIHRNGRSLQLGLRYDDGPSPLGQFFLTPERLAGAELVVRW